MSMMYFLPILFVILFIIGWFFNDSKGIKKQIVLLSKLDALAIVDQQKEIKEEDQDQTKSLHFKLIQAGLTKKEYNEGKLVFAIMGIIIGVTLPLFFSFNIGIIGIIVGVLLIIFGGPLYLYISKSERVEKINQDLGVFLDLINVILEAGGGLKNAFFTVSTRANGILDEELLKEIAILEYEMTNYSTKKAYENLKKELIQKMLQKL